MVPSSWSIYTRRFLAAGLDAASAACSRAYVFLRRSSAFLLSRWPPRTSSTGSRGVRGLRPVCEPAGPVHDGGFAAAAAAAAVLILRAADVVFLVGLARRLAARVGAEFRGHRGHLFIGRHDAARTWARFCTTLWEEGVREQQLAN